MGNIKIDGKDYIIGAVGNVEPTSEWQEGAVCFAGGEYLYAPKSNSSVELLDVNLYKINMGDAINAKDFQLNTIKKGDYISAVSISNKSTFDKVVKVFGLFGYKFKHSADAVFYSIRSEQCIYTDDGGLMFYGSKNGKCRELSVNQVEAIGELKRLDIKRDNEPQFGKNEDGSMKLIKSNNSEKPNSCEDVVNKPSHYQFFEGIEVIEIIASSMTREQFKGYCLGNRIKYRLRAGNKDKLEQEIAKSDKYVELYDEHKHLCRNGGDLK